MKKADKKEWFCIFCEVKCKFEDLEEGVYGEITDGPCFRMTCDFCGLQMLIVEEKTPTLTTAQVAEKWDNILIEDRKKERDKKKRRAKSVDVEEEEVNSG